jgi:hypothetical protein
MVKSISTPSPSSDQASSVRLLSDKELDAVSGGNDKQRARSMKGMRQMCAEGNWVACAVWKDLLNESK